MSAEPGDASPRTGIAFESSAGRWVLAVAVLGSGLAFLDGTVVNVALPAIGEDLGATTSSLQWILNGYLLTLASLILLGGSLGDRYGRRRIFVFGVAWFTVASALCAVAPNSEMLIFARLLQGIGGALLTPGSLAMIEASFRPGDRARAIGAWSGLGGVAAAIGPAARRLPGRGDLLAGDLPDQPADRRSSSILMASRHVPETKDPTATGPLDVPGAVLAALGLAGTTYALIEAPERRVLAADRARRRSAASPRWSPSSSSSAAAANPMMPLSIFSSRQFSAANLVTFVVYAALGGVFFLLVAFLQISLRLLADRRRRGLAAGDDPDAALLGPLGRARPADRRPDPADGRPARDRRRDAADDPDQPRRHLRQPVLPAVIVFGVGLTLVVAPVTATVLAAADSRHSGIASGINNAVARVAGLLAVAVLPLIAGLTGDAFYDPAGDGGRLPRWR